MKVIPVESLEEQIAMEQSRILELEQNIARSRARMDVLESLRPMAVNQGVRGSRPVSKPASTKVLHAQSAGAASGNRLAPKQAIIDLLKGHPGLDMTQITKQLAGRIATDRKNPKKAISSTMWYLKNSTKQIKESNGKYSLTVNGTT